MAIDFPDPQDTKAEWPEWTWGEFNAYWADNLAPITPLPGGLLQTRDQTILEAWQHPLSASGIYLAFNDRLRRQVDERAYFAARSAMDALMERLDRPTLTTQLELSMPQLIVPDCFQVSINAISGGQVITNVVGVRKAGGTAAQAAAAVQAAWKVASGPMSQKSNHYALVDFRAMDLSSANGAISVLADGTVGARGVSGGLATNAACALVKWNGGTRSASSRGRLYFGPLPEQDINTDGRTLTTSAITAIDAAMEAFKNKLTTDGFPLVVISRKTSSATTVQDVQIQSVIATQRRRIR